MALGTKPALHASDSFFSTVKTQKEIARNNTWARHGLLKAFPGISPLMPSEVVFWGKKNCPEGKEHRQAF